MNLKGIPVFPFKERVVWGKELPSRYYTVLGDVNIRNNDLYYHLKELQEAWWSLQPRCKRLEDTPESRAYDEVSDYFWSEFPGWILIRHKGDIVVAWEQDTPRTSTGKPRVTGKWDTSM